MSLFKGVYNTQLNSNECTHERHNLNNSKARMFDP